MTTTYEVEKFARGTNGQWFGMGARRFIAVAEARSYFEQFAGEQKAVLSSGIRIDLRVRKGRRVIATVGGRSQDAATIRELA
jgi:hypothetical protein